jgi:hypothetical protein
MGTVVQAAGGTIPESDAAIGAADVSVMDGVARNAAQLLEGVAHVELRNNIGASPHSAINRVMFAMAINPSAIASLVPTDPLGIQ